jgi:hypothetical protein
MNRIKNETKKIINKIIYENIYNSAFHTYNFIGSFLGGFVLVFFFCLDGKGKLTLISLGIGLALFLIIWIIITLFLTCKSLARELTEKKGVDTYGEAIKILSHAFADLHEFERQEKSSLNNIVSYFEKFCTAIKLTFDHILPSNCYVSIKILVKNETQLENPKIITFCRDLASKMEREPKSDSPEHEHFVQNNSCFQHFYINIGKKKGTYYLNNNLISDSSYKNSSHNFYGNLPNDCKTEEERLKNWKLPYKSELVVPLVPLNSKNLTKEILGFICVDCDSPNVFSESYDPFLLLGAADGMYNVLKKYHSKNKIK